MYSSPTPSTKEDLMKELKGNDIFVSYARFALIALLIIRIK